MDAYNTINQEEEVHRYTRTFIKNVGKEIVIDLLLLLYINILQSMAGIKLPINAALLMGVIIIQFKRVDFFITFKQLKSFILSTLNIYIFKEKKIEMNKFNYGFNCN